MSNAPPDYDLIIVGSGIAGLYAAIKAREVGLSVLLVTKSSIEEASTRYAQGGIAAAVGAGDSPEKHLADTLNAGAGLVDEAAARILCSEAASRIADLARFGVQFDSVDGQVNLGHEGAHSQPRILHARGDGTGLEIETSLSHLAQEKLEIRENTIPEKILLESDSTGNKFAVGIESHNTVTGVTESIYSRHVMLATGGAGQIYKVTTNPQVSTGDGVALGYNAGAVVTDMEFVQFHPTALVLADRPVFLISEALRGDGAQLLNNLGERFMSRYDKLLELAPRDIVARAIVEESINTDKDHVWLDIRTKTTEKSKEWLFARFPQISSVCVSAGIDISRDLIPVSPAAHYLMGGLVTNTYGETSVPGLFAIGETACTGVHGANRLASNSLLETVIFAHRAIDQIISPKATDISIKPVQTPYAIPTIVLNQVETTLTASEIKKEIQNIMWTRAGVVRNKEGLEFARVKLEQLAKNATNKGEISDYETQSLLTVSRLMIDAALKRTESRGSHFREDFPASSDSWKTHIHYQQS